MRRRELLCVVATGALAGCNRRTPPGTETEGTPNERVELVDHSLVRRSVGTEDERAVVEGTVRINEEGLLYIELQVWFLDEEGAVLDSTLERIQELDVGIQEFAVEYARVGEEARAVAEYDIEIATVL